MSLGLAALNVALSQEGVRETGPNDSPEIRRYLASVGLGPGHAWCAAFTFWAVAMAARQLNLPNPLPRTGGVLRMWRDCSTHLKYSEPAKGRIYVQDHGKGKGHTGFVLALLGDGEFADISGNTNGAGSREGTMVLRKTRREADCLGYIDLDAFGPPEAA